MSVRTDCWHPLQRCNSGAPLTVLLVMVEFSFTDGSGATAERPNSRRLLVSCNREPSTVFREKARLADQQQLESLCLSVSLAVVILSTCQL